MKKLLALFIVVNLFSCVDGKKQLQGETEWQIQQNAIFKDATTSPLEDKDRKNFNSLDFFDHDDLYEVTASLQRTPDSEYFKMKTTTDEVNEQRIYGIVSFELKKETFSLNVYQSKESLQTPGLENYLFLPFLDNTNGEESYGGGRYLDLRIPNGNNIEIDFNKAYNPFCVYNEKYSCPIVPRDNYLNTEIKAGMRSYVKETP